MPIDDLLFFQYFSMISSDLMIVIDGQSLNVVE